MAGEMHQKTQAPYTFPLWHATDFIKQQNNKDLKHSILKLFKKCQKLKYV